MSRAMSHLPRIWRKARIIPRADRRNSAASTLTTSTRMGRPRCATSHVWKATGYADRRRTAALASTSTTKPGRRNDTSRWWWTSIHNGCWLADFAAKRLQERPGGGRCRKASLAKHHFARRDARPIGACARFLVWTENATGQVDAREQS